MTRWRSARLLFLTPWLFTIAGPVQAYELRTHGEITRHAFEKSEHTKLYLEAVGIRPADVFDRQRRTPPEQLAGFDNTATPQDWMIEGAIREDDYTQNDLLERAGCRRPHNPESKINRPLHHFFDVQREGRGLTVTLPVGGDPAPDPVVISFIPAPDWALGRQGRGPNPDQNQFSILDARVHQLKSLTEPTKGAREENTARLFRTLGHVIHVLQDMAQPQHTRNDPHAGCLELFGAGEHSWFEAYIETRALGQRFRERGEPSPPLPLGPYDPPRFTTYQDFWTATGNKGLADFSSRNFFSAGTNLSLFGNCGGLSEPPCRQNGYQKKDVDFSFQTVRGTTVTGQVRLFLRTMQDPVTGASIPDVAVTSRSWWDQHLESLGFPPAFSLNTLNYDSISGVLLPRAVGYSAGLLDYFFRGTLDFTIGGSSPNQTLTITNNSNEEMEGTFTLYADNSSDVRTPIASFDLSLVQGAISSALNFTPPAEVKTYILVFQGRLGLEDGAVAAKVKQIPLNAFFVWHVRLYNDQFDLVHRGSGFTGACFFSFVRSITSSGTHSGQRKDYLFFAFVNNANLPVSPLDPANLQLTTRVSPSESIIPHFGIRYLPFSGSALGIIQPAGEFGCSPTLAWSFAPAVLGLYTAAQVDPNFLAKPTPPPNQYVYLADNDSLLHDTGVAASEDILVTKTLTKVSFEQIQQTAHGLHPLLVPPASFPRSAALYAFAEFDIPNIDSWNLQFSIDPDELANQKLQWGGTTPIASASVAESWDLQSLTLLVSGEAEINISAPHQRIRRLDFQAVYGTQYQITLQRGLESLTLRHNPNDPFTPITESLP